MLRIIPKTLDSISKNGLLKTIQKIALYPFGVLEHRAKTKRRLQALALKDNEKKFTEIYSHNLWGSDESVSGVGSTLECTKNLRAALPDLLERLSANAILDAPCGDFNWMRHALKDLDVIYTGGDIVRPLIERNNRLYSSKNVRFIHIDLIRDNFPTSDLMICRDCLFHLSYEDTRSLLRNFVSSEIPYFLTTTHINNSAFQNRNIVTGDFRRIDLFAEPYCFSRDVVFRVPDWIAPQPEREMCLWSRAQIAEALPVFEKLVSR